MHHKKIETCFRAPITCLPNGFPTGSYLPCPLSSFLTEVALKFIHGIYKGTVCSKYPWHRFKLLRAISPINVAIENMHRQVIFFDKVKCVNIIQQNFEHHCKFTSHVCCCQALAPRLSQEKGNFCQMVQLLPFHFFRRKNCTVPSGTKFSPVFPVKRKAPRMSLLHQLISHQ